MVVIESLYASYGSIQALKGVSLQIGKSEIVAVIGPNGAGKTSLLRAITGLERVSSGSVNFLGEDITNDKPFKIIQKGIAHALQGRQVFNELTVRQNLILGAYYRKYGKEQVNIELENVYSYFPILRDRNRQKAGTLSGGEQVMLAIGRGLMSKPQLFLLDEPSLGLAPKMVDVVFNALKRINDSGNTVILVEQNAELAFDLAERCYVMDLGRIVLAGSVQDVKKTTEIADLYLGKAVLE